MTSEEIKKLVPYAEPYSIGDGIWLKEIAYQLAVMNERQIPAPITMQDWEFGGFMKGQNK
jgi:hypothetical protein